jgi:hypothetical protein
MSQYNQSSTEAAPASAAQVSNIFAPQFSTGAYGKRSKTRCSFCSNAIFSQYFLANGRKICATCAEQARSGLSTASRGSLFGALFLGIGGVILAMILYSVITTATGWTIGYLALGIGWIVGKSVIAGANGVGSGRIQLVAVLLTYVAITLDSLPAFLYANYNALGSISNWPAILPNQIISGLESPVQQFSTMSVGNGINILVLLIGLRLAWRIAQVQQTIVAGPYDVTG